MSCFYVISVKVTIARSVGFLYNPDFSFLIELADFAENTSMSAVTRHSDWYLVLTLALVGGGRMDPPWFFANNSCKTRRIAAKLTVPSRYLFYTYCENFKSMSCQVIKL